MPALEAFLCGLIVATSVVYLNRYINQRRAQQSLCGTCMFPMGTHLPYAIITGEPFCSEGCARTRLFPPQYSDDSNQAVLRIVPKDPSNTVH